MAELTTKNPFINSRFKLMLDGKVIAGFSEVVISVQNQQMEQILQADKGRALNLSGVKQNPPVQLKRGITITDLISNWYENTSNFGTSGQLKNLTLSEHNMAGEAVASWQLSNAWPTKLEILTLNSKSEGTLIDLLIIEAEVTKR